MKTFPPDTPCVFRSVFHKRSKRGAWEPRCFLLDGEELRWYNTRSSLAVLCRREVSSVFTVAGEEEEKPGWGTLPRRPSYFLNVELRPAGTEGPQCPPSPPSPPRAGPGARPGAKPGTPRGPSSRRGSLDGEAPILRFGFRYEMDREVWLTLLTAWITPDCAPFLNRDLPLVNVAVLQDRLNGERTIFEAMRAHRFSTSLVGHSRRNSSARYQPAVPEGCGGDAVPGFALADTRGLVSVIGHRRVNSYSVADRRSRCPSVPSPRTPGEGSSPTAQLSPIRLAPVSPGPGRASFLNARTPSPPPLAGADLPETPRSLSVRNPSPTKVEPGGLRGSFSGFPGARGSAQPILLGTPAVEAHARGGGCLDIFDTAVPLDGGSQPAARQFRAMDFDESASVVQQFCSKFPSMQKIVELSDSDWVTPLHIAARFDLLEITKQLLVHNAPTSAQTREMRLTPLHLCLYDEKGSPRVFRFLTMEVKVSTKIENSYGMSVISIVDSQWPGTVFHNTLDQLNDVLSGHSINSVNSVPESPRGVDSADSASVGQERGATPGRVSPEPL